MKPIKATGTNAASDQVDRQSKDFEARLAKVEALLDIDYPLSYFYLKIKELLAEPAIDEGAPLFDGIKVKNNIAVEGKVDGTDISDYVLARELEEAWKLAYKSYYAEFSYTAGALTNVGIWNSAAKTTKLFNKDFTYVAGLLTTVVLTRISDSKTLTKTFTYNSGVLATKTVAVA